MHEMQEKFILNPENIIYLKFFFLSSLLCDILFCRGSTFTRGGELIKNCYQC